MQTIENITKDKELVQINLSSLPNSTDIQNQFTSILTQLGANQVQVASKLLVNLGSVELNTNELHKLRSLALRHGYFLEFVLSYNLKTQAAAHDEGVQLVDENTWNQYQLIYQPVTKQTISVEETIEEQPIKVSAAKQLGMTQPSAITFIEKDAFKESATDKGSVMNAEIPFIKEAALREKDERGQSQAVETDEDLLCETMLYRANLRSGQVLHAPGHLVLIGDAHAGSEIIAGGDIYVWGQLNGIAHAGANGRTQSIIAAFKIEALQLRIADMIARRPDRLFKAENVLTTAGNNRHQVEVARIVKNEIQIFEESLRQ